MKAKINFGTNKARMFQNQFALARVQQAFNDGVYVAVEFLVARNGQKAARVKAPFPKMTQETELLLNDEILRFLIKSLKGEETTKDFDPNKLEAYKVKEGEDFVFNMFKLNYETADSKPLNKADKEVKGVPCIEIVSLLAKGKLTYILPKEKVEQYLESK